MDFQKFLQGKAFDAYEYFGAHLTEAAAYETETESWCF